MSIEKALFGNSSYQLLRGALDAAAMRQKVLADVANGETPGFRAHEVAFEEHLSSALGGAPPLAMASSQGATMSSPAGGGMVPRPQIVEAPQLDATSGSDPGDFDMERAMAELDKNRVQYAAVAQLLSGRLIGLKQAIDAK